MNKYKKDCNYREFFSEKLSFIKFQQQSAHCNYEFTLSAFSVKNLIMIPPHHCKLLGTCICEYCDMTSLEKLRLAGQTVELIVL